MTKADSMWFFPLLRPYDWRSASPDPAGDHVRVAADLSDLFELIAWAKAHDAECERIAANAGALYTSVVAQEGQLDYMQVRVWEGLVEGLCEEHGVLPLSSSSSSFPPTPSSAPRARDVVALQEHRSRPCGGPPIVGSSPTAGACVLGSSRRERRGLVRGRQHCVCVSACGRLRGPAHVRPRESDARLPVPSVRRQGRRGARPPC